MRPSPPLPPYPPFFRYLSAIPFLLLCACASQPDTAAVTTAPVAQYNQARDLIRQPGAAHDPESALALMEKSANQGYVKAQSFLGQMYLSAVGIPAPDVEKALYWYQKASENGGQREQMDYAMLLATFGKTREAKKEGIERLEALADAKYPPAQFMLSSYYANGTEREKNTAKALSLLTEAATAGEPMAQYMLGFCYLEGKNVRKDRNTAIMWFRQSAKNGNHLAIDQLREMGIPPPSQEPEK